MSSFIPTNDGDMVTWLKNYISKVAVYGPQLGMTAGEITAQQQMAKLLVDQVAAANAAAAASKKATEDKNAQKKVSLSSIRDNIAHFKTNPHCTDSMLKDLQADSAANAFDPATYKTTIKLAIVGGKVVITFVKGGVEGVDIYTRLKGETTWVFLGHAMHTPYTDQRLLAKAGVAEIREYMIMGEYKDQEIGLPSDIASISFAG